jgi:spore germination cell wall hydrolase CwlJ-like protein
MDARAAFGVAILTFATSCVGPVAGQQPAAQRAPATAAAPTKPAPVIPAGPSAALLAKVPEPTLADALAVTPAPAFVDSGSADAAKRALECLTAAVYYEARSEPLEGQQAVAQVVLNRVRNPAYPASVCGTVYEGSSRSTGCQFSFTCDGSTAARREPAAWERARQVAEAALAGFVYAPVGSATYYHTTAVNPWWAAKMTEVAQIGAHIFYRLPGAWGSTLAFRQHYAGVEPVAGPGTHFRQKATEELIEAIEAGVRVHRGGVAAAESPPPETAVRDDAVAQRFGVTVHRGAPAAISEASGVTVHRSRAPAASADEA